MSFRKKIKESLDVSMRSKGAVMMSSNGTLFHPLYPYPIEVEEIAHSLSHICRYGGRCPTFWSVAQHSLLCSYIIPQKGKLPLYALMHDAHEFTFGDWPKPMKNAIPELLKVEAGVELQVRTALRIPQDLPPEIREVDLRALEIEMNALWTGTFEGSVHEKAVWARLAGLSMREAKEEFLARYKELSDDA